MHWSENKLTVAHISELILLPLVGPPLSKFKPERYVKAWFKQDHRSAYGNRAKKSKQSDDQYKMLWSLFEQPCST